MKKASNEDVRLGRFLSLVLRHNPQAAGITLDQHGWADVEALIQGVRKTGRSIDRVTLERIVRENDKQRYIFNDTHTKIRANQGHSIQVDIELREAEPPQVLYHGTSTRAYPSILQEGIRKMSRQYVHLSADFQTAMSVGKRHGVPIVITIDAAAMRKDKISFFLSENGVWLCGHVPPDYFLST